jgi:hypothetical protein
MGTAPCNTSVSLGNSDNISALALVMTLEAVLTALRPVDCKIDISTGAGQWELFVRSPGCNALLRLAPGSDTVQLERQGLDKRGQGDPKRRDIGKGVELTRRDFQQALAELLVAPWPGLKRQGKAPASRRVPEQSEEILVDVLGWIPAGKLWPGYHIRFYPKSPTTAWVLLRPRGGPVHTDGSDTITLITSGHYLLVTKSRGRGEHRCDWLVQWESEGWVARLCQHWGHPVP